MILGVAIMGLTALAFFVVGYLIMAKEKINLLHSHHRDKVAEADKTAFCTMAGWGILSIGLGCALTAILIALTESPLSFLALAAGFAVGLALLNGAEKRYNSGK